MTILFHLTAIPFRPMIVQFHFITVMFHSTTIPFRSTKAPFRLSIVLFRSMSVTIRMFDSIHPLTSVQRLPFTINPHQRIVFLKPSVLYCYKLLGHGTTQCPRMMKALPFSQSPGINYEIKHNPLSRLLWAHDLHDGTIKRSQRHHHSVQLLPEIQVQVTLHQRYIKVHLEGLINGVHMLLHLL